MDGKKLIKGAAAALAMIGCMIMIQALPVYADGNPSVVLNNAGLDMKKRTLQVDCNMAGMDKVTNGKLRVTYDGSKLRLLENQTGSIVSGSDALCEMNDCLTGNKKEGEIVFAFASAGELPSEGCLASMKFSIADEVAVREKVKVSVSVENMAGNEGNVNAGSKNLTVTIRKDSQGGNDNPGSSGNPGENGGGQNERPGITGNSPAGSGDGRGGNLSSNITGSSRSSDNSTDSLVRSSIKSKRGDGESEEDGENARKRKNLSEKKDEKEASGDEDERKLQTSDDENVPKAGLEADGTYGWIIPVVILAAVVLLIAYKKKKKKPEETKDPTAQA